MSFSLYLTKLVGSALGRDRNIVFSPLSIQTALGPIATGSKGKTLAQIFPSSDDLTSLSSLIVSSILADGSAGGANLAFASGVWFEASQEGSHYGLQGRGQSIRFPIEGL
ncbi:Serpin-ZX [Apostasia shenzhenica]|uniref:Serpin-ZX n=1 Tax=Apostasia shenzhenica TaxID=1088818 RepID=A0A2I0B2W8_9ASPA|nr:Serpin-ZX [Apostasia shenzhenica]